MFAQNLEEEIIQGCTIYVTRSVKTRHNHASLNLQYKALNTIGETFVYCVLLKKFHISLNALFLVKKGPNSRNQGINLFTYSRGTRNSLFCCSRLLRIWKLWAFGIKMIIVCNQSFFTACNSIIPLCVSEER